MFRFKGAATRAVRSGSAVSDMIKEAQSSPGRQVKVARDKSRTSQYYLDLSSERQSEVVHAFRRLVQLVKAFRVASHLHGSGFSTRSQELPEWEISSIISESA
ncbi:Bgt-5286 [Blumeria graminis f. sp. tritici]|uniref:Bgt-5286 n=2 Tax=Blumeria graminis f. sp. tritici TaxID=62690 RepID=A0A061HLF0_BLUGR|nr:mannosidase GPI-anchored membrane protein [Blumeria graminis f. sp. tritici 96224]VCU40404.1 Bgt-5286 [Blumeria graminis f. sp. tritici]